MPCHLSPGRLMFRRGFAPLPCREHDPFGVNRRRRQHIQFKTAAQVIGQTGSVMSTVQPAETAITVFVSYSWDSEDHKKWVLNFVELLRADGINAIVDQMHLAIGERSPEFMERSVRESRYVLVVCTGKYKRKFDNREGGAGFEGHIISGEIINEVGQNKFIPVLRSGDWNSTIPTALSGVIGVDLRNDSSDEYQKLLRRLHGISKVSPIGSPPSWLARSDVRASDTPNPLREPSEEAKRFLNAILAPNNTMVAVRGKFSLLDEQDRVYVLNELARQIIADGKWNSVLDEIMQSPTIPRSESVRVAQQIIRAMTLYGDVPGKAAFLRTFPNEVLGSVDEGLRVAFFEDVVNIVKRDQFDEVNKIVPPLIEHVQAVPRELWKEYVLALLNQAKSAAYIGAPAAQRALESLPEPVAQAGIQKVDKQLLARNLREEHVKKFVARFKHLALPNQQKLFKDFLELSEGDFFRKCVDEDFS